MKNVIVMSALALGLVACASNPEPQPAPQPVAPAKIAQPARACGVHHAQTAEPKKNCDACSKSYTVSEPVEVIYKNVTYTTVYEPKTYSNTTYVKKPYNCQDGLCNKDVKALAPIVINK